MQIRLNCDSSRGMQAYAATKMLAINVKLQPVSFVTTSYFNAKNFNQQSLCRSLYIFNDRQSDLSSILYCSWLTRTAIAG
jgi:hypothetical protein